MKLPFFLTLDQKPCLVRARSWDGDIWRCATDGSVDSGFGLSPEHAWAEWFKRRFPGSPHVEVVHRLADEAWRSSGHLVSYAQAMQQFQTGRAHSVAA